MHTHTRTYTYIHTHSKRWIEIGRKLEKEKATEMHIYSKTHTQI